MEGIYFSMSKIVNKITVPVRKEKKSKSIPNLLKPPVDGSGTFQNRRKSASGTTAGKMEKETLKIDGRDQNLQSSSLVHPHNVQIERAISSDASFNRDPLYENDLPRIKDGGTHKKKKKVPPKRPPPPKFSGGQYQVYANLFRSRSDSEVTGSVYANYQNNGESEKLEDLFLYENDISNANRSGSDKDLDLYENEPYKTEEQSGEDWYIFMANEIKVDESEYVVMSPDRSMTF
ncbi:uncharacterized protein LOC133194775 [Saccostrea echinata]|uniref:uncharacterized protein LOC133194775 n=1 Tax=Saccostrea echinata TaxID=191078 RepID=UPI002A800984|nr:uncharacterized protein LOC133194775 [Saccostrea echinata]